MRCHLVLSYGCPWTGAPCCSASSRLHQQRPDAGSVTATVTVTVTLTVSHLHIASCAPAHRAGRTELTCARTHTESSQHISGSYSHSDNSPKCMHMAHTGVIAAVTMAVACHEVCTGRLGVHVACRLMHPVGLFGCPCIHTPACHVRATWRARSIAETGAGATRAVTLERKHAPADLRLGWRDAGQCTPSGFLSALASILMPAMFVQYLPAPASKAQAITVAVTVACQSMPREFARRPVDVGECCRVLLHAHIHRRAPWAGGTFRSAWCTCRLYREAGGGSGLVSTFRRGRPAPRAQGTQVGHPCERQVMCRRPPGSDPL